MFDPITSLEIKAWPPDTPNLANQRAILGAAQYFDAGGRAICFVVPGEGQRALVEDELVTPRP